MHIPDTPEELLIATEAARLDAHEALRASCWEAVLAAERCKQLVQQCSSVRVAREVGRVLAELAEISDIPERILGLERGDENTDSFCHRDELPSGPPMSIMGAAADAGGALARAYLDLEARLAQLAEGLAFFGEDSAETASARDRLRSVLPVFIERAGFALGWLHSTSRL